MNAPIYVVAYIYCAPGKSHETIKRLANQVELVRSNEPDTFAYYFMASTGGKSDLLVAVEAYRDETAVNHHMSSSALKVLLKKLREEGLVLRLDIIRMEKIAGFLARPDQEKITEQVVLLAQVTYKEMDHVRGIEATKKASQAAEQDEPGTLTYLCLRDPKQPEKLYIFERYVDRHALEQVHVKSRAFLNNAQIQKRLRKDLAINFYSKVLGYVGTEPISQSRL